MFTKIALILKFGVLNNCIIDANSFEFLSDSFFKMVLTWSDW